jgi:lipid II:glycine glycyltransferase (peptidoglycan interpeptide bridge formation enzyme)
MGFITLAFFDNIAIAANVYFCFGKEVIYKYGASDKTYQNLRANNLVMWEAIKLSYDRGFQGLCFGRTDSVNVGLRQFISGWGGREHLIKYYKYDLKKGIFINELSLINPFYNRIFGKLPLPVLNTLGRILYRHIG